jgi:hypothetical protein
MTMRNSLTAILLFMLPAIAGLEISRSGQLQQNRAEAAEPSAKNEFKAAWMGKPSSEVEAKFGRPTKIEKLKDTGGTRYSYRSPGQPHYVFEFSPSGKVTAANIVD